MFLCQTDELLPDAAIWGCEMLMAAPAVYLILAVLLPPPI